MRKTLICLLVVCGSATANAQYPYSQHPIQFRGALGATVPLSPEQFRNYWYLGVSAEGGVMARISSQLTGLLLFDVNTFTLNDAKFIREISDRERVDLTDFKILGGRVTCVTLTVNIKASLGALGERTYPYVLTGVGISHVSQGAQSIGYGPYQIPLAYSGGESAFVAQLGMGMDIRTDMGIDFFFEARATAMATEFDRTSTVPLRFGVRSKY